MGKISNVREIATTISSSKSLPPRIEQIRRALIGTKIYLCPERAYLLTEFFKHHDNPSEPIIIRKARALHYLLSNKKVIIYPDELIVGNPGTYRKSCILQPELASIFMSRELLWIERRKTNPFEISWKDKIRLATEVIPYWLRNSMPSKMFKNPIRVIEYAKHQLEPTFYLINEAGGIGHFLPDYEKILRVGTEGLKKEATGIIKKAGKNENRRNLAQASIIVCDALKIWAKRFSDLARTMANDETGTTRRRELMEISRICRKVPGRPAETFHEAIQSLWLTHLAVMLESLNSAVSFGRIDQYLYPYYEADIKEGRIDNEKAEELLLCFSAKACEHVFLLSEKISEYHGGYLVVQAAIVGGTDQEGNDAVNPLSYLMLDVMEKHRMRDPNYQARIHPKSPRKYLRRALDIARQGYGVPALFNDDAVIAALTSHGYPLKDARNFGIVGCVEPSIPGKSFLSTDAGLFNLPICMELALNKGYRFGGKKRVGAKTRDPLTFRKIEDVIEAYRTQLDFMVDRMIEEFHIVEKANMEYNPTPLSSTLVKGCLEKGLDLTEGGAIYNSSGIQGVGVADVADSLAALDLLVFQNHTLTMGEVIQALRENFQGQKNEEIRAKLAGAPKFGNDIELPDQYAGMVVKMFHDSLARHSSLRRGKYVPGFYSVTCHVAFGKLTGALPSGRRAHEPFGNGIGPSCSADRQGPTALLNSCSSLDARLMPNGNALNVRFDPDDVKGEKGLNILEGLLRGFFEKGGMEIQFNVLDPDMLQDAKNNPGKYPELVVRVAGYCAYFDDLPESTKDEIIKRTRVRLS